MRFLLSTIFIAFLLSGCQMLFGTRKITGEGLIVPFIKNTPNECYFLDEFMPAPNHLVTGRSGSLNLRYYTYNAATYKDWQDLQVVLSFYSMDSRCWSLYEEYYIVE